MYFVAVLVLILLFAVGPALPILICSLLGIKVDEANSAIGALPWALFFTVPIGAIALLVWLVWVVLMYLKW